jgi:hypothetical protein
MDDALIDHVDRMDAIDCRLHVMTDDLTETSNIVGVMKRKFDVIRPVLGSAEDRVWRTHQLITNSTISDMRNGGTFFTESGLVLRLKFEQQ